MCVVEVVVPLFAKRRGEVMNRVTVVKSVGDSEAWPPEFAKYNTTPVAEAVDTVAKSFVEAQPPEVA